MRDIGRNIRDLRVKCGLTQEELAGKLFVTRQTVSNYENGKTRPDVDSIVKLADVLHTDANAVLYGLPVQESRKEARRRMLRSSALLAALLAAAMILHPLCGRLQTERYLTAPSLLLNLVFDPILMLTFGWWIMDGTVFLLRPKPLRKPWAKGLRAAVTALLAVCAALLAPYVLWLCIAWIRSGSSGSAMSFPNISGYREAMQFLAVVNLRYAAVYILPGCLLRISCFPKDPGPAGEDGA